MTHLRLATHADAEPIAQLHVTSWRNTYRGILRDDFLDGPAERVLSELWAERLRATPPARQWVGVIEEDGRLAAFACVLLDEHPEWGALLDNLHVVPALKRRGLGRAMIAAAASWVMAERPGSVFHLWVFEKNAAARRFYEWLGGERVELERERALDGELVESLRYAWRDPGALIERATATAAREEPR